MNSRTRKVTYKKHIVLHMVPCMECGSPTPSNGTKQYCPECKAAKHKPKSEEPNKFKEKQYIVISNPNTEYGFFIGQIFSQLDIDCMTSYTNSALDIGMVLKYRDKYFIVEEDKHHKQKLVPIPAPA